MMPSLYLWIKYLHVTCALLSITGFCARGVLAINGSTIGHTRWIRTLPHINDSILLACAIYLAMQLGQYPGTSNWLSAKVIALIAYILLGMATLKWSKTRQQRILAMLAAVACFTYIVAVAITRNAWPFASLL